MVSAKVLALGALAAGAIAAPLEDRAAACLCEADAQQVATNFGTLIANYTKELADAALTPNFMDYSESVNSLINECPQGSAAVSLPLLNPTFSSRDEFETGQGQQPAINFQQLNMWYSCSQVTIRWMTTNTAPIPSPKPVVGIISAEVQKAKKGSQFKYKINKVYSEFDAAAWLENLNDAGICATATSSTSATSSAAPSS